MGFPIELNGIQSIAHMKPEFPAMEIVENLKSLWRSFGRFVKSWVITQRQSLRR